MKIRESWENIKEMFFFCPPGSERLAMWQNITNKMRLVLSVNTNIRDNYDN